MTVKHRAKKKTSDTRRVDVRAKDQIAELKNRVAALENELRLKNEIIVLDTAEHKQTVEKLAENEGFLRNIFECIQDGISVLDKDLNIVQVNPPMEKWYGERIRGKKCYQAYHGRSEPCEACPSIRAIKTGSTQKGIVHDLNGWMEIYAFPMVNDRGEVTGVIEHVRDINEHMRAQEALRESEEKFRALAESARAGIILTQGDKFIYVNPETVKDLGYSKEELLAMNFWDVVHPDSRELVKSRALERLQGKPVPSTYEMKVLTKGGETLLEELSSTVIDYMGKSTIIATLFNITERNRAEEALRKSEANLERAQRIAALGNWELDLKTGMLSGSREYYRLFGFEPRGSVPFEKFASMLHPDDRKWVDAAAKNIQYDGLPHSYEFRILLPDGSIKYMDCDVEVLIDENGQPVKVFGAMQDITERKRAEKALVKEKYILTKSQEIAHVGNWAWNLKAGELTGSVENYRIWGVEPGEVTPTMEWVSNHIHPDDRKAVLDFLDARAKDGMRGSIDYRIIWPDGSVRHVNSIVDKSVWDRSGRVTWLYGISQDITERKHAEEELMEAKAQAELYLDLMSHDINNMHQVALGYLELARGMPPGEDQTKLMEKPVEVLHRSTRLISNLKKLERLRNGALLTQDIDVCRVLSEVQREYGDVPNKSVTLNLNGHECCLVRANELLPEAFTNLVGNAIKHTGDRANIAVDLDTVKSDDKWYYQITVEDDGPGITDEFKGIIFNRGLRGTSKAKGMGLGLYLVKSLVHSYDGKVWVEDRVQGDHTKGTRFVVILPAVDN